MNNMGAITERKLKHFIEYVREKEFPTSSWKWTNAGSMCMCFEAPPLILIDRRNIGRYPWAAKEAVLHEFAHVNTIRRDQQHGQAFYEEYVRLLSRFMIDL